MGSAMRQMTALVVQPDPRPTLRWCNLLSRGRRSKGAPGSSPEHRTGSDRNVVVPTPTPATNAGAPPIEIARRAVWRGVSPAGGNSPQQRGRGSKDERDPSRTQRPAQPALFPSPNRQQPLSPSLHPPVFPPPRRSLWLFVRVRSAVSHTHARAAQTAWALASPLHRTQ